MTFVRKGISRLTIECRDNGIIFAIRNHNALCDPQECLLRTKVGTFRPSEITTENYNF